MVRGDFRGKPTKTVAVMVRGDLIDENDETFRLLLSSPTNAVIADNEGVCTIVDNDAMSALKVSSTTVAETNSATSVNFTVSLSKPSGLTVTVKYATGGGTATAAADYTPVPLTTVTFSPGQTTKLVPVQVRGDLLKEANETFFVNLSWAVNATILDAQGQGTILNED